MTNYFYMWLNSELRKRNCFDFKRYCDGKNEVVYKYRGDLYDVWILIRKTSDKYYQVTWFVKSLSTRDIINSGQQGARSYNDLAVIMATIIN